MSCEHLICAQCAGPVVEGRCPACRASRQHVHHQLGATPQLILAALLALSLLLLLALHFGQVTRRSGGAPAGVPGVALG